MIIGFAGKKGSGKSAACQYLEQYGFKTINFADPLKEMAAEISGIPLKAFYDQSTKEAPDKFYVHGSKLLKALYKRGIFKTNKNIYLDDIYEMKSIREFLQWLGTDVVRSHNPDYWVDALAIRLELKQNFCIGDVRFENEANMIKSKGGYIVKIYRPNDAANDQHISEAIDLTADFEIYNTGSLEDLQNQLDSILTIIYSQHNKYL